MPSYTKGFSLVELLVVIGIFTLMTGFVAVKYGNFSRQMLMQNLAYDIALTIREAQSYGSSVSDIGQTGNFNASYGVSFDTATPRNFTLFADLNNNKRLDGATTPPETIRRYTMTSDSRVYRLCHNTLCDQTSSGNTGTHASVIFQRPSPIPIISSGAYPSGGASYLEVRIANTDNSVRKMIIIRSSGQISVQDV